MKLRVTLLTLLVVLGSGAPSLADEKPHWSFLPLQRPTPPRASAGDASNPIDAFVLARLEKAGLLWSSEADRRSLMRRLCLDLIGLPPAPEEIEVFARGTNPKSFEQLVDQLLASSHFGERWGRHWLDGAGYVDVVGGDNDAATVKLGDGAKWKYRDYVVRAINQDRPWSQFLTEQLAGDELVDWRRAERFTPPIVEKLVATGFLRTTADDTDENELNTLDIRQGVLERTGEGVVNHLLGLTLACAKCHDHKFEPILQRDYYRILALLAPAYNPQRWLQPGQRVLPDIPPREKAALDKQNADLDARIKELQKKTDAESKRLIGELQSRKRSHGTLQAVHDVGPPSPVHLLRRGQLNRPGPEVAPGFLSLLCGSEEQAALPPLKPEGASSGRRLALARWLTDARTPAGALAVRVRVNRIWAQLFGRGLVASCDNLGMSGAKPTHPELLEWLACEYVAQGGRLKPFLRMLVTSRTYRQATANRAAPPAADPDNNLLWKMRLRRLESEAIRDSLLAVSGQLDPKLGGPPVPTESRPDGSIVVKGPGETRRSLYLVQRRNYHPTLLGVFDQPILTSPCPCRSPSSVVLQSLTMLNDAEVRRQAEYLAARVHREAGPTPEAQVDRLFALVLGRPPSPAEQRLCLDRVKQAGAEGLRRVSLVLLNTSEFLYVP